MSAADFVSSSLKRSKPAFVTFICEFLDIVKKNTKVNLKKIQELFSICVSGITSKYVYCLEDNC